MTVHKKMFDTKNKGESMEDAIRQITLIRGISGCGKTSLAKQLGGKLCAADDYFVGEDGVYQFAPSKLPQAHSWCAEQVLIAMEQGLCVVVHNTFTQRWEMEPYLQMAELHGYRVTVTSVYDGGLTDEELAERNEHGVPLAGIATMRERFEHDWKNGNPLPPWER